MPKIFKSVDEKMADIGFRLINDNKYCVIYERHNNKHDYIQVVSIIHKKSGRHIIQSYDANLFDNKKIGNTCVGLTYYETKLIMKKMKQKKWNGKEAALWN